MATEVIVPKLGMNMETATIIAWRKNEGDAVAVGDVLADVETDKATIELEAEATGILRCCLIDEGAQVTVSQPIAVIGTADEDITALEQQLRAAMSAAPVTASHMERVYERWKGPILTSAGNGENGTHASTASAERPLNITESGSIAPAAPAEPNGRFDPDAIRQRLAKRGVLPSDGITEDAPPARKRVAIYGSGLGAKQLLEVARQLDDVDVVGLIDDNPDLLGVMLNGVRVLGGFHVLADLVAQAALDGVALSFHSEVRKKVHERIRSEFRLPIVPLVDPRAIVGMDVTIGDGALIEAGATIGPGTVVGEGTIVDVGVTVAHDCYLGAFSHLSPGCALSGVVCLRENVLVGVGASINSTVTIGKNVIITPGSAVMNDLPDDVVVTGVPAKVIGGSRRGA